MKQKISKTQFSYGKTDDRMELRPLLSFYKMWINLIIDISVVSTKLCRHFCHNKIMCDASLEEVINIFWYIISFFEINVMLSLIRQLIFFSSFFIKKKKTCVVDIDVYELWLIVNQKIIFSIKKNNNETLNKYNKTYGNNISNVIALKLS